MSYSPCETDYFICNSFDVNGEETDCTADFEDFGFWSAMRMEQWWQEEANQFYADFYMFWEQVHYGTDDSADYEDFYNLDDCEWRDVFTTCDDFQFIDEECRIFTSYNPCVTDYFICEKYTFTEYGEVMEECNQDFEDVHFWSAMREEQYWQAHEEYSDFFTFWDEYHFGDNVVDCQDKHMQGQCSDFNMLADQECGISVSYNTCDTTTFTCEMYVDGQTMNCMEDFADYFFWSQMREEPFWMANEEYSDFFMFWEEYHFGSNDYDTDDHTDDWGNDDYTDDWGNDDWGNDDDWGNWDDEPTTDCQYVDLEAQCADFEMFAGDQCSIYVSYNTCDDTTFVCEVAEVNEFGERIVNDCTEDFEQAEFWSALSQEEFWFEDANQQYMDFYMFWNTYHMTEDPCEWKDVFATCNDFTFTEGECSIYLSYSPCDDTYFVCEMSVLNEYMTYEVDNCADDFEDVEFWN